MCMQYNYTFVVLCLCDLFHSLHTGSDRQWKIECSTELNALDNSRRCQWSSFYKLYEQELSFSCPARGVVAGVYSDYSGLHGDRRWAAQ